MKVGELFIELGLKGADATARGLETTAKTMRDVASDALKATAAVTALLYGFKKITDQSNQTGLGLSQFKDITGLSADQLQRWQQLAMRFGESAEEITGDIKNVQSAMTDTVLKGKFPEYIQAVNIALQRAGKEGINTFNARDTFGVMAKLREYAKLTAANPDIANKMLASFGLSDKTIGALRTSTFDLNKADKTRMYSDSQIKTLNNLSVRWSELIDKIQHGIGRLNIKFGPTLLKDIEKLIPAIFKMIDAFGVLAEKLQLIKQIGKVFDGWTKLFSAVGDVADDMSGKNKQNKILPSVETLKYVGKDLLQSINPFSSGGGSTATTTNNVTIHVQAEGDPSEVAEAINLHIQQAFRQMPQAGSQGGGV